MAVGDGVDGRSSSVRIIQRPAITAMYESASSEEAPAEPDGGDEQAGQGGADDAGARHQGAVQADGVLHVVLGHHLDDEGAAGRVVEGDGDAADQRDGVDAPAPAGCR